jgi:hypothetical protein
MKRTNFGFLARSWRLISDPGNDLQLKRIFFENLRQKLVISQDLCQELQPGTNIWNTNSQHFWHKSIVCDDKWHRLLGRDSHFDNGRIARMIMQLKVILTGPLESSDNSRVNAVILKATDDYAMLMLGVVTYHLYQAHVIEVHYFTAGVLVFPRDQRESDVLLEK